MLLGLLFRIPFGGGGILLSDILLPIFAGCYCIQKWFIDRNWPLTSFFLPALSFVLFCILTWIWGAWGLDIKAKILSFSYIIRFFSILILGIFVFDNFKRDNSFLYQLFGIVGIIVLGGFIQFYFVPDISKWSTVGGFDPHMGRLLGTWMDPNFVAGLLGFFLPVMVGAWYKESQLKMKVILGLLILACLYAGFLTFSRSGYLSIAGGLFFFFLLRDPKIILLGILVMTAGLLTNERAQKRVGELSGTMAAVIFRDTDEVDPTAKLRVQSWRRSYELWQKYPVLGIGYNTYRFRAAEEGVVDEKFFSSGGSDSTLLTILVTTGIGGVLLFCWFYFGVWWRNFMRYWHTKNPIFLGFVGGWSAILVHSVFVNSLLFPLIFMPMIALIGWLESEAQQ